MRPNSLGSGRIESGGRRRTRIGHAYQASNLPPFGNGSVTERGDRRVEDADLLREVEAANLGAERVAENARLFAAEREGVWEVGVGVRRGAVRSRICTRD